MARIAGWRDAFRKQGLKPATYRSSPEALARRLLRGQSLTTPLPVVNTYNAVSIRFLAPIGGYDVDRLPGHDIDLRFARPSQDIFTPLGGRREDMPLLDEVVVYAAGDEITCWAFNHRDSARTCLREETQKVLFLSEAVTIEQKDVSLLALQELRRLLFAAYGGNVSSILIADKRSPVFALRM